ncbi:MAG TPA: peptidase [Thermoanaerobaculia bacterium]|nr:peptidase [Thermoanaerobaculia bacterium]
MRKLAFLFPLLLACQTSVPPGDETMSKPPATTTPEAPVVADPSLTVRADTPARLAQLPRTVIDYDRSLLNENERQVVEHLIAASKAIDEIFWRQVSEENPALRARLAAQANESALDRAGYEYFIANKGRWDRLDNNEPFIEPFGPAGAKPAGAAFYPPDITKEEFERYVAAHPEQQAALQGLFTVVRREGDRLVAIPYSRYYAEQLRDVVTHVNAAAATTTNPTLRDYLQKLAAALMSDQYRQSDMAWMDLTGPIEVVIGPYEVYEDELFNFKAAFESFITVVDRAESEKLAVYGQHLPAMEQNLPIPDRYKNPGRGTESPIRVVQEIYTAGDARRGVQTAAFNLPNDEFVREQKGSKKVLLKNVMDAKYRQSGHPIALRVLDEALIPHLSFDAFFNHVLFHELSHGLGPGLITNPDGQRVDVRLLLKDTYSTIEEAKADVLGIWNILYAQDRKLLSGFDERQLFATYAGLMFRSMRFGVDQAHGRGNAIQWNWLREKGAITPIAGGRYTIDIAKMKTAVRELATELLTIQATGDYDRARRLLDRYGVSTPEIESVTARLADIPVDITPVFPAAGER